MPSSISATFTTDRKSASDALSIQVTRSIQATGPVPAWDFARAPAEITLVSIRYTKPGTVVRIPPAGSASGSARVDLQVRRGPPSVDGQRKGPATGAPIPQS